VGGGPEWAGLMVNVLVGEQIIVI